MAGFSSNGPKTPIYINYSPSSILGEMTWRGDRIIYTDDPKQVGDSDASGFKIDRGFIVRDAFDEPTLPVGMSWFYSPFDAIAAIECRDFVLPAVREHTPNTTLMFEYSLMMSYRRNYQHVHAALRQIENAINDARAFDDNPSDAIMKILHNLRQLVAQSRGIAPNIKEA